MAKKKTTKKTLVDLKEDVVESEAKATKTTKKSAPKADVISTRITSTATFPWGKPHSDLGLAQWHARRHGGRLVQEGKYYILNKR